MSTLHDHITALCDEWEQVLRNPESHPVWSGDAILARFRAVLAETTTTRPEADGFCTCYGTEEKRLMASCGRTEHRIAALIAEAEAAVRASFPPTTAERMIALDDTDVRLTLGDLRAVLAETATTQPTATVAAGAPVLGGDVSKGYYHKYDVHKVGDVEGVHRDCSFFVLDLTHDTHALSALLYYADAVRESDPDLRRDLLVLADAYCVCLTSVDPSPDCPIHAPR